MDFLKSVVLIVLLGCCVNSYSQNYEADFQARSQKLVDYLADSYYATPSGWYDCNSPSDYGKYNWQIVVACFHKYGVNNTKGNNYLPHFDTPSCLPHRFHFNLMGETFIFAKYWNAPSVKSTVKNYLTAAWNRNDSYNLMTSEGTENHINMTRPAAYLYAQIAKDSFPADFPNAALRLDSAKTWITDWAKTLYQSGSGEWNASKYYPYNVVGWLALYEGAKDSEVKKVAQAVLDYYACELALHYTQGITGGYESRNSTGYESVVAAGDYLSWLWFGNSPKKITWSSGSMDTEASQSIYAAVSSYRPPLAAVKLANKVLAKNAMYYNSKGEYLMNNPGALKQTFYIGKTYTLGAAYLPYGGFTGGDADFQVWKFVGNVVPNETTTAKTANIIVGSGAKEWIKSRFRNPWDQVVHHKNVLIQMTKVPTNYTALTTQVKTLITQWQNSWKADFSKRFLTDGKGNPVNYNTADVNSVNKSYMSVWKKNNAVSTVTNSNIVFYQMDSNYVAIRSIAQNSPTISAAANDNYGLSDNATQGNLCGLILEVGSKLDYTSFADFQNKIITTSSLNKTEIGSDRITYTSASGDVLSVQYNSSGTFTEPLYDWGYGPIKSQLAQTSPPFIQPSWPTGQGCGRLATWSVNGTLVDLTSANWGVFDGPNLSLKQSVLKLNAGGTDTLRIDYSGRLPIYNGGSQTAVNIIQDEADYLKIYPNPATEVMNVELRNAYTGRITIELLDLSGRLLLNMLNTKSSELGIFQVPLSKNMRGMYIVKINAGEQLYTIRVQINQK